MQSVPNPGCDNIQEKEVHISIDVRRECSFGFAGFTENDMENALEKARELQTKSDSELFEEGIPNPEELFAAAVHELLEGDKDTVSALADTFEFFAKATMGPDVGRDSRKLFLEAAVQMAAEIRAGK